MEDISNKAAQKRQELAEQVKELPKNFESPKNQWVLMALVERDSAADVYDSSEVFYFS